MIATDTPELARHVLDTIYRNSSEVVRRLVQSGAAGVAAEAIPDPNDMTPKGPRFDLRIQILIKTGIGR